MASADSDGKAIEEKKHQLRGTRAQNRWGPDEDHETVWEDDESFIERNNHLDDGDLEYINVILNSFSRDPQWDKISNFVQKLNFFSKSLKNVSIC
jgi:hypothetical protein